MSARWTIQRVCAPNITMARSTASHGRTASRSCRGSAWKNSCDCAHGATRPTKEARLQTAGRDELMEKLPADIGDRTCTSLARQLLKCFQHRFALERLDDPALDARRLAPLLHRGAALRGQHDHVDGLVREFAANLFDHRQAVHIRHVD